MAKLTKNLAPLFDSSISYEPGERFMYGDHMYEALEPLSGAFDSTKVSEVTLADIFKGVSSNDVKCLAPEYDVNTEYSVENLVLHDGVLYECVETTTGPFDETKWSRKYLSDVGGLNSNLSAEVKYFESKTGRKANAICRYTYTATKSEKLSVYYSLCYSDSKSISVKVNGVEVESISTNTPDMYTQYGQFDISLTNGDVLNIETRAYNSYSLSSATVLVM